MRAFSGLTVMAGRREWHQMHRAIRKTRSQPNARHPRARPGDLRPDAHRRPWVTEPFPEEIPGTSPGMTGLFFEGALRVSGRATLATLTKMAKAMTAGDKGR